MKATTRRDFLKSSIASGLALGLPQGLMAARPSRGAGPNEVIRLAVVGLGGTKTIGGVGGRGHQLIAQLRKIPTAKIVALCDVDQSFLDRESRPFQDQGRRVATYRDLRRLFEDKTIDAVVVATPNHWHALATVWACQAGKDVYVEKPFSYDLWEGRQAVAAARKYGRMVQVGMQNRSSRLLRRVFDDLRGGELGPIRFAHAVVYRPRDGIGRVSAPTPIPPTIDYDLWCGPSPKGPLMRKQLHYEWHWFWATGNGEIGNNGIHMIDLCRWALGQNEVPPRGMSLGGRFAFNDCGQTANTHVAFMDYQPAPLICEVRNLHSASGPNPIGRFRNLTHGIVIDCEGGYFAGSASGGAIFDKQGKKIKDLRDHGESRNLEVQHLSNFLAAVRSRNSKSLAAEALEGHLSAASCHVANISYRVGTQSAPETIRERTQARPELLDAFERCREHLRRNGVDLNTTLATLGPWVTYDSNQKRFVHDLAERANELSHRKCRAPFVFPEIG